MDVKCIKKTIDFLFPDNNRLYEMRCTPRILIKSTFPSRIKKDKITPEFKHLDVSREYSFICSLVRFESWLSSKTDVAHCLFDVADFSSCEDPNNKLPIQHTQFCNKNNELTATVLMTPARLLKDRHLDVLSFENHKRKLKSDEYRAIIYEWLK